MKKILVTGGAGYVGAQTCKLLKQKGYNPVVFDNMVYGHSYAVQWGECIIGDLTNFSDINHALQKVNPLGIVHCAAYTYVGESVTNPYKYYHNNVLGSLNLCKSMVENNINNIIFSSTCATFGVAPSPIDEQAIQQPISPYGNSKLMVEMILKDFDLAHKLKYITLRYFNVAGADKDTEIGEDHNPETHLIPLVIDVALGKKDNVNIFGNNYNTLDGTCVRDYIHVEDLAQAHCLSLEYLLHHKISNSFNLGTEKGHSVQEVITSVEKISKKPIKTNISARREGDPAILIANSKKAKEILKWMPTYTNIDDIVHTAYKWHKKQ